ncbi:MAG: serine hydrolase [Planctomycetota bacterium]
MRTGITFGSFLLAAALGAQTPTLAPLSEAMERLSRSLHLDGAGLLVVRDGGELHRSEHGDLAADAAMPIASASKWLAVATILTLVDDGTLDLDVPVARYVTELDRPDKRAITLRQCLSCTAGFPARLPGRLRGFDMAKFAAAVADAPLRASPGTEFLYGGVTFQVAALAAERATGKSFHALFAARIAEPLGLGETRFGALLPPGDEAGTAALPWVAGGAVSSLDDYARFVQMLVAGGVAGDHRVLSRAAIDTMLRDEVPERVEVRAAGFAADHVRYGLGTWLLPLGDGLVRATDPGAFGFTPWLDRDLGIGAVFAVRDRTGRVLPSVLRLQDDVREAVRSPAVTGSDIRVALTHAGRDRAYVLHLPPAVAEQRDLPLVLVLHGEGGDAERAAQETGFAELADREGFVAVFADGTGALSNRLLTWNSGGFPCYAADHDVDDVGFLRAVVGDVAGRVAIAAGRVFAVGHGNGGMMCHRLAREASDLFAGIAVVGGAMDFTAADPTDAVGVLIVHGTQDEQVPYLGGAPKAATGRAGSRADASVQDAIDYWLARNGLFGYPQSVSPATEAGVRIDTYGTGADGKPSGTPVRVITLDGGGHAWPGGKLANPAGDRPFAYAATRAVWDFFTAVQRGPNGHTPAVPR